MMIVTLIRPLIREYFNSITANMREPIGLVPPLNLCCIAAEAEKGGHDVSIFDCEAQGNSELRLENFLIKKQPAIVGITVVTTNFRGALQTARVVRRTLPDAIIVGGGTHMMLFPAETLSHSEFDYGFMGEAEKPFLKFLDMMNGGGTDLSQIPGLVWRSGTGTVINEPCGFNDDLDALPFPAYHLLDLTAYRMYNSTWNVISLFLSRGCPFNCGFCYRSPQLRKVRFKSVDRIMEEITFMREKFNVRSISFVDETISLNKEYFIEFCDRLSAKGWDLEWQAPTRVTSVDEDIVRAARKSGCYTLRLGIESGDDGILKKINKGISTVKSREAVGLCKKYGIKTVGYFIIGYPGETEETIKRTIAFAKSIKPDYAIFFPATPMPSTQLCKESEERGLIPVDYWRDFVLGKRNDAIPFIFPAAGDWAARAHRSFYFSPAYILGRIKTRRFYANFFRNVFTAAKLLLLRFRRNSGQES
ncbi:MAG: radical SAM protein [Dissulfurispiraceae bacterium]